MNNKKTTKLLTMILVLATIFTFTLAPLSVTAGALEGSLVEIDQPDVSPNDPRNPSGGTSSGSSSSVKASSSSESTGGTPKPTVDFAVKTGETYELKCYAVSGGSGTAYVNGVALSLKESPSGVYAAKYSLPSVEGVKNLGFVDYEVIKAGKSVNGVSGGQLFAVGSGSTLSVQVINASVTAFKSPDVKTNGFITTLKRGAVDTVSDYKGTMYFLSSVGGWVEAGGIQPLTNNPSMTNNVSSVDFSNTTSGEMFTICGTSNPPYTVTQNTTSISLTFLRTFGVPSISAGNSSLFSSVDVVSNESSTTLTFNFVSKSILWGYLVTYDSGNTNLLFRKKPTPNGSQSLSGITVVVDPGHGGKDKGASGLASKGSAVEKDINLANAVELKRQLESKGATVILTRSDDRSMELSDRILVAQNQKADLFISLHCNSSSNTKAVGTEVFYYEPNARNFAASASKNVSAQNSTTNRGAKYSCFVVTLNSYTPSILVEVGFMTNSAEYKSLSSGTGVSNTAKGITNSVVAMFS